MINIAKRLSWSSPYQFDYILIYLNAFSLDLFILYYIILHYSICYFNDIILYYIKNKPFYSGTTQLSPFLSAPCCI